jgi:gas vesicle protein
MKPSASLAGTLAGTFVRPCVVLALLCACGVEERDRLRSELADVVHQRDDLATKAASLETQGRRDRGQLLDVRKKAEEADAALRAKIDEMKDEMKKNDERVKARIDEMKKDGERVAAHRDELKEWIEKELLPVAEEHDPRLVNLRDAAKDMAAEVENLRGLKFKQPFMRRLLTRDQVGDWMRRDMKKDMTEEDVKKMVVVGAEFGLMAEKTDVYAVFAQFIESGAAAFYKPDTRTFYHIEGNDGRGARPVVFHELVHAVEDQYFDIDAFYRVVEKDADMSLARRALVEGSACHFAEKYERAHPDDVKAMEQSQATPEMIQKQMKMMNTVPPALVASMGLYPYKNAPTWLEKIGADDSSAIEKLYADPPVSTEQVLHPEKFPLDGPRDYPHKIATPDVASILGDGYENVDDNDMGELMIGLLLTQLQQGGKYFPTLMNSLDMKTQGVGFKGASKTASEGWDGDRYTAWVEKSSGKATIVWVSVWDSEKDAREFYETYGDLLGKRILGKEWSSRPTPLRHVVDGRTSGLDISGTRVVAVLDAPADKAEKLFAAGAAATVTADPRDPNDK